jgi:hypothetical protein
MVSKHFFPACLSLIVLALLVFGVPSARAGSVCEKPRLLIVLDRSVSMTAGRVPSGASRWDAARAAVSAVTSLFDDRIDFGLMVFPYPDRCAPGAVVVEPSTGSSDRIDEALAAPVPLEGSWTPMAGTIEAAAEYLFLSSDGRPAAAVLVTDGEEWCYPYDPSTRFDPVDAAELLVESGSGLHVVGFGGEGVDALVLNTMAELAGTGLEGCDPAQDDPLAGDNCFHNAADIESLAAALEAVAMSVSDEICDGLDNDCNGLVDDGLERECFSACGAGMEVCEGGLWLECDAPEPADEVCNLRDDDCDGDIDEGCACMAGEKRVCGITQGECKAGLQTCEAGAWSDCLDFIGPEPEACDGLDNDCNGMVDDGAPCNDGLVCRAGECADRDAPVHDPQPEEPGPFEPYADRGCGCTMVR